VPDFDVSEDENRLRFDMQSYVIGKTVVGLVARRDRVELNLEGGCIIAFRPNGSDVVIEILVPRRPLIEPRRIQ
jgi:hypothetical protein